MDTNFYQNTLYTLHVLLIFYVRRLLYYTCMVSYTQTDLSIRHVLHDEFNKHDL